MPNQTPTLASPATSKRGLARARRMARPPEDAAACNTQIEGAGTDRAAAPRTNKTTAVIALLTRPDGATLAELIEATGWLPHTTRAALSGLRKRGYAIERFKRNDATCYRIGGAAQ